MKLNIKSLLLSGSGIFALLLIFIFLSNGFGTHNSNKVKLPQPNTQDSAETDQNLSDDLTLNAQFNNFELNSNNGLVISHALQEELDSYEVSESQGFNSITDQDITFAKIEGDKQIVTISVDENGFSTPMIVVQKDVPVEINFKALKLDYSNYQLHISTETNVRELKDGDNIIILTPNEDFTFQTWTGIYYGYIAVVNDLNDIDLEQLKDAYCAFEVNIISASGNSN